MALQDVAHRLIADDVPQISQRPDDTVITPVMVLFAMRTISCSTSRLIRGRPGLRHAFEPSNLPATSLRYQARIVSGRATVATSARTLLAAQSMADFSQRGSLGVRKPQPPFQLSLQDAIFGRQIFIPRQQPLVHHPRDEGQDARPIHSSSTVSRLAIVCSKNRSQRHLARLCREWTTHRLFDSFNFLAIRGR
jgi:hypothetical protein